MRGMFVMEKIPRLNDDLCYQKHHPIKTHSLSEKLESGGIRWLLYVSTVRTENAAEELTTTVVRTRH